MYGDEPYHEGRVAHAFRAFPWKGGWSTVDFYQSLTLAVPPPLRPKIVEIQYASPGHITLELAATIALQIGVGTLAFAKGLDGLNTAYRNIQKGFIDHKLNKVNLRSAELRLAKEEEDFLDRSISRLGEAMELAGASRIHELSPNKVISLKVLLSLFRRFRDLAKFQAAGKMKF